MGRRSGLLTDNLDRYPEVELGPSPVGSHSGETKATGEGEASAVAERETQVSGQRAEGGGRESVFSIKRDYFHLIPAYPKLDFRPVHPAIVEPAGHLGKVHGAHRRSGNNCGNRGASGLTQEERQEGGGIKNRSTQGLL